MMSPDQVARFWAKVEILGPEECWLWCGEKARRTDGHLPYGIFKIARDGWHKKVRAHRVSYEIAKGPIPDGLLIRHSCDVRLCVNPGHLDVGTNMQNHLDCVKRGRLVRGSRSKQAKLTEEEVAGIRVALSMSVPYAELADQFNVGIWTVHSIAHRLSWKHVDGPPPVRGYSGWSKRGRPQSAEHVRKRMASRRQTLIEKGLTKS